VLLLVRGEKGGEHERIGIVTTCDFVWFSEYCERSTAFNPGLKIDEAVDLDINQIRERETIEEWFNHVKETEITPV
jgi:hypothetical protein